MSGITLYSDAPIAGTSLDALGRQPFADRLLEVATVSRDAPLVAGLVGTAGSGKTSILHMAGELCAARTDLRAFAIDAWIAGDAAKLSEAFVREVSQTFEDEGVIGRADKLRDRLFAVGDVVSAVARLGGVKLDVKGALERSPDSLRAEVLRLTEAMNKRVVVFVDHLDRLAPPEATTATKLIARWGTFPYFAFILAIDRAQLARKLTLVDGNADDLDRLISVDLPIPPIDRATLAGWIRGGLVDLARAYAIDPEPALALFDVETGAGFAHVATLRDAKRLLNTVAAALPLAGGDLRALCTTLAGV